MPLDEDDPEYEAPGLKKVVWTEFDCPGCSANNPYEDGFRSGDEVLCNYCGIQWKVRAIDERRFKLIEA